MVALYMPIKTVIRSQQQCKLVVQQQSLLWQMHRIQLCQWALRMWSHWRLHQMLQHQFLHQACMTTSAPVSNMMSITAMPLYLNANLVSYTRHPSLYHLNCPQWGQELHTKEIKHSITIVMKLLLIWGIHGSMKLFLISGIHGACQIWDPKV